MPDTKSAEFTASLLTYLSAHGIQPDLTSIEGLDTAKRQAWEAEKISFNDPELQLFRYPLGNLLATEFVARWIHSDNGSSRFQVKCGDQAISIDLTALTAMALSTSGPSFSQNYESIRSSLIANGADRIEMED